ncbi:meiosis-specific protein ASY1-like [Camellia sinensis]|uniref:meiosis-specific protein ASY1-like n=1 Tax=Camellia sinensis TaxID=4442 RepID=UPI00103556E7|nr:meiosis-specific protein ASY1-like [Camellia sinensis]
MHSPSKTNVRAQVTAEVGNVNNKHFVLALKVKSMLDPCEDENDDIQDDDVSLGADFVQRDEHSESVSEVSHSQDNQYIVTPIGNYMSLCSAVSACLHIRCFQYSLKFEM